MADFSFISRCGKCSENPLDNDNIKIDCGTDGNCCIDISVGTRQISCPSASSIVGCLSNPDFSYQNGVQDPTPIPNLGFPNTFSAAMEVFKTARKIVSPCGDASDSECTPYGATFSTNNINNVNDGRCRDDEPNNYALLTDPEKTVHPVYEMTFCEWLVAPTSGDPPVSGGGCTTFTGDRSSDPTGATTCGLNSFLVPQCGNVCCPINDFSGLETPDSCKEGENYYFEVKNCTGYETCKNSCGSDGICSCSSNSDCKTGDLCNTTYGRCYTPDQSEVDQCVVRPKTLNGVCTGWCGEDEIAAGKGEYPNCCTFQITHERGTTCTSGPGGAVTCCADGMECRDQDSNQLLMPSGQQTWNDDEGNTAFRTGVGVCICSNNDQCESAGAAQTELYSCEKDPHSSFNRNVCVSGTIDRCYFDESGTYPEGLTSGPPNILDLDLPGFGNKGCKQGVSCSTMYNGSNLTYGHCECNTDGDCEDGYTCKNYSDGINKCIKVEAISGIKPSSLADTSGIITGEGKDDAEYEETYATGGYFVNNDSWTNKRCNYCNDLVSQGCQWSRDDPNCNNIPGKTVRINDCTIEVDAPPGQLIWEGWGNDWSLCCSPSGVEMPVNLEVPVEFIDIDRNRCSSWTKFAANPNQVAQKTELCSLYCPDRATQDSLVSSGDLDADKVCDANYFDLCTQTGCSPDVNGCRDLWPNGTNPGFLPKITAPDTGDIITYSRDNKGMAACNEGFANVDYVGGRAYSSF